MGSISGQGTLFESPKEKDSPRPVRFRLPLEKRKVSHPSGKPDGKGKFFYQKMYDALDELPEVMRERFNDLTFDANFQHVEMFAKALRLYCSGNAMDHIDFDVARGMLSED